MIKILKTPEFENICPHFVGAAIEARVTNSATNSQLWEEIEKCCQQLRADFTTESIKHRSGIAATRQAYKAAGKDPSRYRPACEQLARRILQGKELYAVNTLVDLGNLVSLSSGYATAALDADKIEGEKLTLSLGTAGEPYEGIGRGVLNIENLPIYRDSLGGIATPTSDNIRTAISLETRRMLLLINGYDGNQEAVEAAAQDTIELLQRHCAAESSYFLY